MPTLFPFIFVGMWVLVCWILAQCGWVSLAKEYRFDERFEGAVISGLSGRMGWVSYNNVLILGANRDGLSLSVLFLFRIAHPPLFIRWSDIKTSEQRIFFTDWVLLNIDKVPGVVLKLRKKDVLKLKEKAQESRVFEGIN